MARLIIPTRNRPAEIRALFEFLGTYYPGTAATIADGGDEASQDEVAAACEAASGKVSVVHRRYPVDLPLFERLLDVTIVETDEYFKVHADDDYPLMDVYARAEAVLEQNPRCANVVAAGVLLRLNADDSLVASIHVGRSVLSNVPAARVRDFCTWMFGSSYSVGRRAAVIERYRVLGRMTSVGFVDFQVGVEDCLSGTIIALPEIGSLLTHRASASYLRPSDRMMILRRSDEILSILNSTKERLISVGRARPDQADRVVNQAVARHLNLLLGAGPTTRIGFTESPLFRNEVVQEQYRLFYELFQQGSEYHLKMQDMMKFAVSKLREIHGSAVVKTGENYEHI